MKKASRNREKCTPIKILIIARKHFKQLEKIIKSFEYITKWNFIYLNLSVIILFRNFSTSG